ncbi:DUF2169 domain-containing protein [Psychromonas sp. psych-6C06]|uniref:DUF2169 family type VI secretion system accessory protein n=1 Tax=Psychromonas sp. psych-6C06 TaxID=2058089 RepID=UPI000C34833D|nr:DUF2169 domain-containing protein [Psychromonas sp. psych-6C06]PKF60327.1 DUF2169 domain-containing protein [Psychromonas sp. psych-6C06]
MLQINNTTPFAAEIATFPNEQGIDSLYVIVKASFIMGQQLSLADEQIPPQMGDEYWAEPGLSSIKHLSDFHIGKSNTDIIMQGNACAPHHQAVKQLDVHLSVGKVQKTVRVFGDRVWQGDQPSLPVAFQSMPLVYERAFGGQHQVDATNLLTEERNTVGCGFVGKRNKQEMQGLALPNIEDPNQLIQSIKDNPMPAGFGPCNNNWLPRRQWAGTYDEQWQTTRAPYLPEDFNKRFLNAAHPDLVYPGYLQGGEPIMIKNMHPAGDISLKVPQIKMACHAKLSNKRFPLKLNIETLTLEPNKQLLSMVWLAPFECDKNLLKVNEIEIKLSR